MKSIYLSIFVSICCVCFLNCHQRNKSFQTTHPLRLPDTSSIPISKYVWISNDISFDSVDLGDNDYMIYGFATLLKFERNNILKAISMKYEFEEDTILWGEGPENYLYGEWHQSGQTVFIDYTYTDLSEDSLVGKSIIDTFSMKGELLVSVNGENYKPAKFLSPNLYNILNKGNWYD